jgi:hypothetical protein
MALLPELPCLTYELRGVRLKIRLKGVDARHLRLDGLLALLLHHFILNEAFSKFHNLNVRVFGFPNLPLCEGLGLGFFAGRSRRRHGIDQIRP